LATQNPHFAPIGKKLRRSPVEISTNIAGAFAEFMKIASPVYLSAHPGVEPSPWEMALRYGASTLVTLLAIGGAQLEVRNDFAAVLATLTLLGVPVSLYLRLNDMRVGPLTIHRGLWNAATVLGTFVAALGYVWWTLSRWLAPILSGQSTHNFWLNFGSGEAVTLLIQVFLIFAAFRSFALISDKDATLATVPSFSVLLLLIPVHKGIEVVIYFLAWTVVATFLFALDHRSEIRTGVSATVPSLRPGQDVRLATRSLFSILGLSLAAALGISYYLASRDASQRSSTETAITTLATRLTNMAFSLPNTSVNSGPERQIDFSSSPNTASRSALWQVQAWTYGRKQIRPEYWRLFALDYYNGATWAQHRGSAKRIKLDSVDITNWPSRRARPQWQNSNASSSGSFNPRDASGNSSIRSIQRRVFPGFDIEKKMPSETRQFGVSGVVVRQNVVAMVPNIGFVPVVPSVHAIVLPDSQQKEIRVSSEGGFDLGVVEVGHSILTFSQVPVMPEYGTVRSAMLRTGMVASQAPRPISDITLSADQREKALQLPTNTPARMRELSASMLAGLSPNESNLRRAQRMALAIQKDATYTLRPPTIPEGRDAADYFLFDGGKRGYCTYFAGALTVLCRIQGIPSRVVSGFTNAEWGESGVGLLREANAHAWTEVWVEGKGWAIVDATPAADRGDNAPTWIENWGDLAVSEVSRIAMLLRGRIVFLGIVALIGIAALLLRWRNRYGLVLPYRKSRLDEDGERRAVIEIYRRISRHISRRFRPRAGWETPDEWVQPFTATLAPDDAESLRRLTALYLHARYGSRPLPDGSALLAREIAAQIGWKRLPS
jgi:hypothetical protein